MIENDKCICKGNWRLIISECQHLIGKEFISDHDGQVYRFFGLVHAEDDYYYGMVHKDNGKARLLSCVGNLDTHGFKARRNGGKNEN